MPELVSIVIRTLNEERYLPELLEAIARQESCLFGFEVVIVDSGSSDRTLEIAREYGCRITHISRDEFTFGRSLNRGCGHARGKYLVFVSGHCIPASESWMHNLVLPIHEGKAAYTYGRQLGRDTTKFSERQLFDKYFPGESRIPQVGFFCNNANAALRMSAWQKLRFAEDLTGLEDMHLAKQLIATGEKVGYVAVAPVFHIHDETWGQVKVRYEREAVALQRIMPELHFSAADFANCFTVGVVKDLRAALAKGVFFREFWPVLRFRFAQYSGVYAGNHMHRKMSSSMKMKYFYPRITDMDVTNEK